MYFGNQLPTTRAGNLPRWRVACGNYNCGRRALWPAANPMDRLAETCQRIAATTKKTEKVSILAEYFRSQELGDGAVSALFLSGRAFPAFEERTLQVGGSAVWRLVAELSGARDEELTASYRKHGDLGSAAFELLDE